MKALITGITGFVGPHLAQHLMDNNIEVAGIARWRSRMDSLHPIKDKVKVINADIRDGYSIQRVVKDFQPDYLFHLAAQSYVPESWNAPLETLSTNIEGTVNVLEAVRLEQGNCTVHIAGSSEEYGRVHPEEAPIKEDNPLRPMSPYGVSKVASDLLGQQYYMSYHLDIKITRAFNHTGPGRGEVFVTSNFCKQVAEIEACKKPPVIYVGNLEAKRDFTDVRDTVKAYWLVASKGISGDVYNICTGKAISIQQVLDTILGLSAANIEVQKDPKRMRPSDVPLLEGDPTKIHLDLDWTPTIPFLDTMRDLLYYWRERV